MNSQFRPGMPVIKKTLIIIVIVVLVFELVEHVLLPLIWYVMHRKKKPVVGVESMIGEEVEVRAWENFQGQVAFRGVLWSAKSDDRLTRGEKVVIEDTNGLMLRVKRRRSSEVVSPQ